MDGSAVSALRGGGGGGGDGTPDVAIVGSGVGGAIMARTIAPTGARVLILERGEPLRPDPRPLDAQAVFRGTDYRARETWFDHRGKPFNPIIYYQVGGNTKFFGAVMLRYRREDFGAVEHLGGVSPAWPFPYEELEPYYCQAEALFRVHGRAGEDPLEPPRTRAFPHPPAADETSIARARERLERTGLRTFTTPLCVDVEAWLRYAPTHWGGYPNTGSAKADAENAPLQEAMAYDNVRLWSGAKVTRLRTDPKGEAIVALDVEHRGERKSVTPRWVVLSAGTVDSAALLLRSASDKLPRGLANRSGMVGRHFMNHHCSALMAVDPRTRNDAVYQKTIGINDYYFSDGEGGPPLGHAELMGKISVPMLQSFGARLPRPLLDWLCARSLDWFLITEDLPLPGNRLNVDASGRIHIHYRRSNWPAHERLVARMKKHLRAAGYPLLLSKAFDLSYTTHQCGTVRMGLDPAKAPLDPWCRSFDHPNLWVVDASCLPTSAAVGPCLTVAAQALRAGDRWLRETGSAQAAVSVRNNGQPARSAMSS